MSLKHWPAKDPAEKVWLTFDFKAALEAGETITATQVTVELMQGTDATPANIFDGASQTLAGNKVMQKIMGGVDQAVYLIKCVATLSSGRVLALAGRLTVERIS